MSESERTPNDIVHLKLRFREDLRQKLEYSAVQDGNSLNTEIVHRLKLSLEDDRRGLIENALLSGSHNARIIRGISALLIIADEGQEWNNSIAQRWAVRFGINRILDALMPLPSADDMGAEEGAEAARCWGEMLAVTNMYLRRIGEPQADDPDANVQNAAGAMNNNNKRTKRKQTDKTE